MPRRGKPDRKTRRQYFKLLGSVGAAGLLAGCGGGGSDGGDGSDGNGGGGGDGDGGTATATEASISGGTYEFWNMDMPVVKDITEEQTGEFENEQDATVNWNWFPFGDYQGQLTSALQSSNAPVITGMTGRWLSNYAAGGNLVNLEEHGLSNENVLDSVVLNTEHDGTMYAVPHHTQCRVIIINRDMFREAGLEIPEPTHVPSYDEFKSWARELTTDDHVGYVENAGRSFPSYFMSNGGSLFDDFANPTSTDLDSDPAVETLQFLTDMVQSDYVNDISAIEIPRALDQFTNGNAAMMYGGNWFYTILNNNFSDIDYQFVPMPTGPSHDQDLPVTWNGGAYFSVPAESVGNDSLQVGIEWLKRVNSVEFQERVLRLVGASPARQEVYELDSTQEYLDENPILETGVMQQPSTKPFPVHESFSDMTTAIRNEVQAAYVGNKSPEEAVSAANQQVSDLL